MRNLMLAFGAVTMVASTMAIPSSADARKRYAYREWRDSNGRERCRRPDGTVGTIVGGVAGALVGRTIDTRGDRTAGTVLGAAGGALLGNQIAKGSGKRRCR